MEINSYHLKCALLAFYRYKRGAFCADEVVCSGGLSDILVDNGTTEVIDIEIKTSRADLMRDVRKEKHEAYKAGDHKYFALPNKFYLCVPTDLVKDAIEFVEKTNPNYGVIEFSKSKYESYCPPERCLYFVRKAKKLTKEYKTRYVTIAKRLSSIVVNYYLGKGFHPKREML